LKKAAALPPIAIAAPYPEGAIVQYARWLERNSNLENLWLPSRALTAGALALLSSRSGEGLRSRVQKGTDQVERIRTIAPALELLRLASREPRLRSLVPHAMDVYKRMFDRSVSKHLAESAVVVAMPGAAERTFDEGDGVKVLHAVDGHPRAVNLLLTEAFGRHAIREIVPERRVRQIERELAAADVVLVPSQLKKHQYATNGVDGDRMRVAPYGVDVERFFAVPGGHNRRRPKLLFVGQISYRKGVPLLIQAARGLNIDVELVGPVVEPVLLQGLPENVVHRGAVASADLNRHMNSSDALVLPSLEDAFGLVVLEALASGLPVLTTNETGAAEVVGAGDGWTVPAGELRPLREAMIDVPILGDDQRSERAHRMRETGNDRTWARFGSTVDRAIFEQIEKRVRAR
jgi:glycosyltransferase involved in cell wall biosynthesis